MVNHRHFGVFGLFGNLRALSSVDLHMGGRMLRAILAFGAMTFLVACGVAPDAPLPPGKIASVAYQDDGPPSLTLVTIINNRSGAGAHSALLVSGSQRVLFDPAGSVRAPWVVEQGDVLYGMADRYFNAYKSAHARQTHHVVTQTVEVNPQVAEQALLLVRTNGSVASAYCANSISSILRKVPGFQDVSSTFYPRRLMESFAKLPGVKTDRLFENDTGDIDEGVAKQAPLE